MQSLPKRWPPPPNPNHEITPICLTVLSPALKTNRDLIKRTKNIQLIKTGILKQR